MARARKLFPSYGSALAAHLLASLERGHLVEGFVFEYVAEYDRRGILGGESRDRELAQTIGREVMLAMVNEVRQILPGFFGRRPRSALTEEERGALDAFFRELITTFARAWHWDTEDRRQFRRDFALYTEYEERRAKASAKARKMTEEESPFIGRVALLLDPSMLDQARRAARKFYAEVGRLTQKLFRQTLRPGSR